MAPFIKYTSKNIVTGNVEQVSYVNAEHITQAHYDPNKKTLKLLTAIGGKEVTLHLDGQEAENGAMILEKL